MTRYVFERASPNLHQLSIMGLSRVLLKIVVIDLDLQGHLGTKMVQISEKRTCSTLTLLKHAVRPRGCSAPNAVLVYILIACR